MLSSAADVFISVADLLIYFPNRFSCCWLFFLGPVLNSSVCILFEFFPSELLKLSSCIISASVSLGSLVGELVFYSSPVVVLFCILILWFVPSIWISLLLLFLVLLMEQPTLVYLIPNTFQRRENKLPNQIS